MQARTNYKYLTDNGLSSLEINTLSSKPNELHIYDWQQTKLTCTFGFHMQNKHLVCFSGCTCSHYPKNDHKIKLKMHCSLGYKWRFAWGPMAKHWMLALEALCFFQWVWTSIAKESYSFQDFPRGDPDHSSGSAHDYNIFNIKKTLTMYSPNLFGDVGICF